MYLGAVAARWKLIFLSITTSTYILPLQGLKNLTALCCSKVLASGWKLLVVMELEENLDHEVLQIYHPLFDLPIFFYGMALQDWCVLTRVADFSSQ